MVRKSSSGNGSDASKPDQPIVGEPVGEPESEPAGNIVNAESDSRDVPTIEPNTIGETGEQPKRRRGRPKGSRNRADSSSSRSTKQETANLEVILVSLHMMGAAFLKMPELVISEDEAGRLSEAINRVQNLYDISVIPEKALAWLQLSFVASSIYGPRVMSALHRKKNPLRVMPATNTTGTNDGQQFPTM